MRIISANLNGIRSAASKGFFDWLPAQHADIVCVQMQTKPSPISRDEKKRFIKVEIVATHKGSLPIDVQTFMQRHGQTQIATEQPSRHLCKAIRRECSANGNGGISRVRHGHDVIANTIDEGRRLYQQSL